MKTQRAFKAATNEWYRTGHYFEWDGNRIFYQIKGAGPALLMIHGFPTAGCDWREMGEKLCENFTIIVPDIADAGASYNPRKKTYTLHQHAYMLEALLIHLKISAVHLIGHDVGDAICQELIARQNESCLPIQLISCTFLNGGILMSAHRPLGLQSQLAGRYGWLVAKIMRKATFLNNVQAVLGETKFDEGQLDEIWAISLGVNGRSSIARRSHNMIDRHQHSARWVKALQETPIPMCMINGINDPISGAHACDAIESQLPHMGVIRMPGIGHFPLLENPEMCVGHVLSFHAQIDTLTM